MSGRSLTVQEVGRMFSLELPSAPGKAKCPFRKHVRQDKTFRVYEARSGSGSLWKCWSCDPPANVGDAVGLYALLSGTTRKEAWNRLRSDGFDVPGGDQYSEPAGQSAQDRGRQEYQRTQRDRGPRVVGVQPERVLALKPETLAAWSGLDDAQVRAYLRSRGFPESFDSRAHDVLAMPRGCMGFVYHDPATLKPCRVKVRALRDKVFWNEPRPDPEQPGAKALAPLYRASDLILTGALWEIVVVTEGEIDALSLASVGISNVISLPDGSESAATVSIEPLTGMFNLWLIATDRDEPGDRAYVTLRDRARREGIYTARVTWARMEDGDLIYYKDANDALSRGKFTREDFQACLDAAAEALVCRKKAASS